MRNLRIENSYNTWNSCDMHVKIILCCAATYDSYLANKILNRSYDGMYIEWWLHNIGYWLTRPFIKNPYIQALNERFKHVDLEEHA